MQARKTELSVTDMENKKDGGQEISTVRYRYGEQERGSSGKLNLQVHLGRT